MRYVKEKKMMEGSRRGRKTGTVIGGSRKDWKRKR